MRLKPFTNNDASAILNPDLEVPSGLDTTLINAGLKKNKDDIEDVRAIFSSAGAGINDIATTVANIMQRGENEGARLKACDIAREIHGLLDKVDNKMIPDITINIVGSDRSIVNLIIPDRV